MLGPGRPRLAAAVVLACGAVAVTGCRDAPPPVADPAHEAEVLSWRADRESRLREEESWLTLVGLYWLEPGENRFGAGPGNEIALPEGSAPAEGGLLRYDGERVTLEARDGVAITVNDEPVTERELADDSGGTGEPDRVKVGRLLFYIIRRDGRHAVRVKDPESPVRTGFAGLAWYPVDPRWRIEARFEAYPEPRELQVPTVTGTTTRQFVPGEVAFEVDGEAHSLIPLVDDPADTQLFFIFRDSTSGHETYGAGRYLYGDLEGGRVVLDFNKAYNPPCVFTPYATCTLPPPGNRLEIAVNAGEKMYGEHH